MTIRILTQAPEPEMADSLEAFERAFTYPLGAKRSFSISHGRDYSRFLRAIASDNAASFVAMDASGKIRGTLGVAVRPLRFPDGPCRLAAYLGDLKTAPGAGRGRTLLRLAAEATLWSIARGALVGYGVVMDGTPHAPANYTGRFGLRAFREVGRLCVLRFPVTPSGSTNDGVTESDSRSVEDCFRRLSAGRFAPLGGSPEIRSSARPLPLLASDRSACGILEDTRLAKRLFREDSQEMLAAHLSSFAYANPAAGARLIREALTRCASGLVAPAMFVAIPKSDLGAITTFLSDISGTVIAPATIYGTGPGLSEEAWNISASEI